jgi:hypothetical protein
MAVSVDRGWEVDHVDIVGAYLNSTLKEIVYMCQPEMFEEGNTDDVLYLSILLHSNTLYAQFYSL